MTNQEIVQALKEYMHLDSQLSQLLQEKQKLEKEIDYYKTPKEKPEPERPSKIAEFVPIFCCSSGIVVFVCVGVLDMMFRGATIGLVALCSVAISIAITYFVDKKRNSEACARFVSAGMEYENWKVGRETKLPQLQRRLEQVMNEGSNLYNRFRNAKLRRMLHPDYLRYCDVIFGYFQRGRVHSLTDAINLLEQEMCENRRDRETAAYRKEMQRQACAQRQAAEEAAIQGRRAAEAAEEAAFWGAAATFVAATGNKKGTDDNDFRVI